MLSACPADAPRDPRRTRRIAIDWREPERNADVLDWRRRRTSSACARQTTRTTPPNTARSRRIACCVKKTPRRSTISRSRTRRARIRTVTTAIGRSSPACRARNWTSYALPEPRRQAQAAQGARGAGARSPHRRRAWQRAGALAPLPLRRQDAHQPRRARPRRARSGGELILLPTGELKPRTSMPS